MKRGKLENQKEVMAVKKWLNLNKGQISRCPWNHLHFIGWVRCYSGRIATGKDYFRCKRLFPNLPGNENTCPCHLFGLKYVVCKAKEFVKEWEIDQTKKRIF